MKSEANLLMGVLCVQLNFINSGELVQAMNRWMLDKEKSLGEILLADSKITQHQLELIQKLLDEHLRLHGGSVAKSINSLELSTNTWQAIHRIDDPEIPATLQIKDSGGGFSPNGNSSNIDSVGSRFRVLRLHARGGLGEVYVAEDTELRRQVALKEIQRRHSDIPECRERFMLEAEVTGRLEHPGIVPVYGSGTYPDGRPFYAMRLIRGDSLSDAIEQHHLAEFSDATQRNLSFRSLLKRFVDVCNAIGYAHNRGILHRDLKPGNVMLGKYGETMVVDWGLAKSVSNAQIEQTQSLSDEQTLGHLSGGNSATQLGSAMGTPAYMSPEQARGEIDKLGKATDIYSLGATLYVIVTGRLAFQGTAVECLELTKNGHFPSPLQVKPETPRALNAIILKAMALLPEDRYSTATELADEIEHFLADEPVQALRDHLHVRVMRWIRKNTAKAAGAGAAALVGVISLSLWLWQLNAHHQQLQLAFEREVTLNTEVTKQRNLAQTNEETALRNARTAQRENTTATAVKEFLIKDLLQLASPFYQSERGSGVNADAELRVRDLLLRAGRLIEGKFGDEPKAEAEIRYMLGFALMEVGNIAEAIPHIQRAIELADGHDLGIQRDIINTWRSNLGYSLFEIGKFDEAFEIQNQELQRRTQELGADAPETLESQHYLANTLQSLQRVEEAYRLRLDTLERRQCVLGDDHLDTLWAMNNLANSLSILDKDELALEMRQYVYEKRKLLLGEENSETLAALNNLALSRYLVGEYEQALSIRKELYEKLVRVMGPSHPRTLLCMYNLAFSLEQQNQVGEAVKIWEDLTNRSAEVHGLHHPDTLNRRFMLASAHLTLGDYDQAAENFLKFHSSGKVSNVPSQRLDCIRNLVHCYDELYELDKALQFSQLLVSVHPADEHLMNLPSTEKFNCAQDFHRHALILLYRLQFVESAKNHELAIKLLDSMPPESPSEIQSLRNTCESHKSICDLVEQFSSDPQRIAGLPNDVKVQVLYWQVRKSFGESQHDLFHESLKELKELAEETPFDNYSMLQCWALATELDQDDPELQAFDLEQANIHFAKLNPNADNYLAFKLRRDPKLKTWKKLRNEE